MEDPIDRLLSGFTAFRAEHFGDDPRLMRELAATGQRPEVLVIACSDSRVDPAILTRSRPGDLFIVRNVAAIVPPYDPGRSPQGTSSAIEFAVRALNVGHIVVLGHALCGGMQFLAEHTGQPKEGEPSFEFLAGWVEIARAAMRFDIDPSLSADERARAVEQAGVVTSLRNLDSFPWITERVAEGTLQLHGWYFDLIHGDLLVYDADLDRFLPAASGTLTDR